MLVFQMQLGQRNGTQFVHMCIESLTPHLIFGHISSTVFSDELSESVYINALLAVSPEPLLLQAYSRSCILY